MYVPDSSRQTLEAKMQRFVRPGFEIWTDCWSGHTGLSALGYVHRTVNHSNNFVDPLSGVCTNQVEGYWSRLKQFLRRLGALQSSFLPEYASKFASIFAMKLLNKNGMKQVQKYINYDQI
nr:unnamed protein product [Callosobruchus analis]